MERNSIMVFGACLDDFFWGIKGVLQFNFLLPMPFEHERQPCSRVDDFLVSTLGRVNI